MRPRKSQAAPEPAAASLREEETEDGWVFLAGRSRATRPPPPSPMARAVASGGGGDQPFDPTAEDIVNRYLPLRRALRCDALPRQVHDADVYGAHPALLASVYPAANERFEWFFFVCRRRCPGGRRRAGPGDYRLSQEAKHRGNAYCHSFRYYEDAGGGFKETEWRMVEYGDRGARDADVGGSEGFDLVVCKVYPARGGALHERLGADRAVLASRHRADEDAKPQVLVQLYLASLRLGNPLACRVHRADNVFDEHPAVITAVLPAANDRCEWLFAAVRRRGEHRDGASPRPRKAGPGAYVPVRECRVVDGRRRDIGHRLVFWYREDDDEARRVSRRTEWWLEEYRFGPDFPYGELPAPMARGEYEELVVYKVYPKLVGNRR
uniref:NAC domain-containing protein n=1 Tax=Oryza punctata TaxID=4537 RepID=A0A0E0KSM4_ORYPU